MLETLRRMSRQSVGFEMQSPVWMKEDLSAITRENFYEVIFAVSLDQKSKFEKNLKQLFPEIDVQASHIGWTISERFKWGSHCDLSLMDLQKLHDQSWSQHLGLK